MTSFPAEDDGGAESRLSQIIEGPIEFQCLCEHHALPFFGVAHIGYIAGERIIGISKLTRLVRLFARRFTVQERLGEQIADGLVVADRAARRRRAPRGVAPLHADARRRGALAHDHDLLARRVRGSRAAARVPARSPQPPRPVDGATSRSSAAAAARSARRSSRRCSRAATASSRSTGTPDGPAVDGRAARGRRPDLGRRGRRALGIGSRGRRTPRWVVNAVGGFRRRDGRRLGARRRPLPRTT